MKKQVKRNTMNKKMKDLITRLEALENANKFKSCQCCCHTHYHWQYWTNPTYPTTTPYLPTIGGGTGTGTPPQEPFIVTNTAINNEHCLKFDNNTNKFKISHNTNENRD